MQVGDIRQTEANVHAGVKYVRYMVDGLRKRADERLKQAIVRVRVLQRWTGTNPTIAKGRRSTRIRSQRFD